MKITKTYIKKLERLTKKRKSSELKKELQPLISEILNDPKFQNDIIEEVMSRNLQLSIDEKEEESINEIIKKDTELLNNF